MKQLKVYKDRTNVVPVSLGFDVSSDVITSQIRSEKDISSDLLATWQVEFLTDGTDGELVLILDNSVTSVITNATGYMDLKRVSAGEPLSVFDEPIEVLFTDSVTA